MAMAGQRFMVATYVTPEIYSFLMEEKGKASLSKYVSSLLEEYASFVQIDDLEKCGENEKLIA